MKRVSRNWKPHTFGNTIFDNFFGTDFYVPLQASKGGSVGTYPATNIINTKDQYLVELSVPGYQKEDFLIEIDKGVLTIAAANKETDDKGATKYTLKQFKKCAFSRSFRIAEDQLETAELKAQYEAGVLSVLLPKKEVVDTKLKIEVL